MRIGAHDGIGIGEGVRAVGGEDHARQVLEIDLMDDAGVGRDYAEALEGLLGPAEQGVALAVALEFEIGVELEGGGGAELIDDHGVVDDQFRGEQGIDLLGVPSHPLHGIAHGGEIHHRRNTGEILQQHPRRHEGDFFVGDPLGVPLGQLLDVLGPDTAAILETEEVLQEDAQ